MALTIDWGTSVITVPQSFLTLVGGATYQLDTNQFRIALKELEESEEGVIFPATHTHSTAVTLGGIQYARVIEILDPYTVTFEETGTPYVVTLIGSNNNILEKTNLGTVQILANNSAGLINLTEVQQSTFEGQVAINSLSTNSGTLYPIGALIKPVNNIADAKTIAASRGIDEFFIIGNLTVPSTATDSSGGNVTALHFTGEGATLNVARTTVTLTSGCVTSNSVWRNCKITGYQGGESIYEDCVIDGLENAHCFYKNCGLLDGTSRGYTIKQTSAVSSGHASYFHDCYSDEGTAIIDRNGARLNMTFDGFHGRIKFINQNHATSSGQVWIHLNGGTVTVDSTCTTGTITVTGFGTLVNNSQGTRVDASGFAAENYQQLALNLESLRDTHQAFGVKWFVDPVNGNDASPGNSALSPKRTVTAAMSEAVSGRGDSIYLLAPGAGTATIDERIVVDKEDLHFRGPGRGIQFQPSTADLGDVITVNANNCSFSGFIVRAPAGSTTDNCITINGKFTECTKLYLVGTQTGSGNGFLFRGGDYHELHDCESEKMGGSGLKTVDALLSSGSPREITVFGGNYYLNNLDGIELTGYSGNPTNSTRIIRVKGANVHDNLRYGISADANSTRIVIDNDTTVHSNTVEEIFNLSSSLQHFSDRELITQVKYRIESMRDTHQAFGQEYFVDPINGNDSSVGTSDFNPLKTVTTALSKCISGRGDVIYLIGPGEGAATVNERIVIDKEDVHIRGPGRGVQFQPSTPDLGDVITVNANNCSLSGFIVRAPAGSTTDNCVTVNGKFLECIKLYLVGTQTGTGNGFLFRGGDYHELHDCESEKMGGSGLKTEDAQLSSGSPREVTIVGGNYYLNNLSGIELTGNPGNPTNSTRIVRIKGVNIHDNLLYGVSADANSTRIVIDNDTTIHSNVVEEIHNLSPSLQQFSDRELISQVKYRIESMRTTHQAFGEEFFVDPVNGNDNASGTTDFNAFKTVTKALDACSSGRGDVIFLLGPQAGSVTITERLLIDKEDIHIRGPGRGIQFQPEDEDLGGIITITANNCSLSGFVVRTSEGSLTDDAIVISGKFARLEKLYLIGPGQTLGSGNGVKITGGDYHELHNLEIEKFGDSGIKILDENISSPSGSPREISISGGNFYFNGEHGICIYGASGVAIGLTTRLIRIINRVNVHNNTSFGIHSDTNVLGVVIDESVLMHSNNGGNNYPQIMAEGTYYYNGSRTVNANTIQINGTTIKGDGTESDKFRSTLIA